MKMYRITISEQDAPGNGERKGLFARIPRERDTFQYLVPASEIDLTKVLQTIMETRGESPSSPPSPALTSDREDGR